MNECPPIEALWTSPLGETTEQHVTECKACQAVVSMMWERPGSGGSAEGDDACTRAEVLLAAREAGCARDEDERWLSAHLASCQACKQISAPL